MEWVPTQRWHLMMMTTELQSQKLLGRGSVEEVASDPSLSAVLSSHSRTLLNEHGNPILCIGVWPQWPGVATVWMLVTVEVLQHHPIRLIRQARRFMQGIVDRDNLHRIQAYVFSEHEDGKRFAEHYGFVKEGIMHKFSSQQEDLLLYARTF